MDARLTPSTIRAFPLYKSRASAMNTGWSPSAMFSVGFGWSKTSEVVRVINE